MPAVRKTRAVARRYRRARRTPPAILALGDDPARDSRTFDRSARDALGGRTHVGRVSHQHDLACDSARLDVFLGEPASGISYVFIINTKGFRERTAGLGPECITLRT